MVATDDNPVLQIWCAPHQIDLVVKQAAECVADGTLNQVHRPFAIFVRQQANLMKSMNFKHRRERMEFCVENCPDNAPICEWWLMTFCIAPIIDVVNITFAILVSRSLHIAQQESHVNALVSTLTAMLDVPIVDQGESDDEQHESFKSMRIPVDSIVHSPRSSTTT
ncbi:hypothetical protein DYB37_013053 [Aphanomyces astaci]|uniref:Uncharacterized protein n=1 Tax=Aphanomyces astaci TaxID=112090 RepID=A0A3R6Y8Y3_APHAT|nr:hypothetical protein DYB37_013053 [Aphanomyces astaci]